MCMCVCVCARGTVRQSEGVGKTSCPGNPLPFQAFLVEVLVSKPELFQMWQLRLQFHRPARSLPGFRNIRKAGTNTSTNCGGKTAFRRVVLHNPQVLAGATQGEGGVWTILLSLPGLLACRLPFVSGLGEN